MIKSADETSIIMTYMLLGVVMGIIFGAMLGFVGYANLNWETANEVCELKFGPGNYTMNDNWGDLQCELEAPKIIGEENIKLIGGSK